MIVAEYLCRRCESVFFTDYRAARRCPKCGSADFENVGDANVTHVDRKNVWCQCPHEDCGAEFIADIRKGEKTTCCPQCGRQQSARKKEEDARE